MLDIGTRVLQVFLNMHLPNVKHLHTYIKCCQHNTSANATFFFNKKKIIILIFEGMRIIQEAGVQILPLGNG